MGDRTFLKGEATEADMAKWSHAFENGASGCRPPAEPQLLQEIRWVIKSKSLKTPANLPDLTIVA